MNVKLSQKGSLRGVDGSEFIHVVTEDPITGVTASNKVRIDKLGFVPVTNTVTGNAILEGGIVWLGGLIYYVWVERFVINNIVYNISINDTLTLSDGDATHPRFDNFVVTIDNSTDPTTGIVEVLEGTPAANPVLDTLDLITQAQISFRLVAQSETTDPTTTEDLIYDENLGEPTEWDNTFLQAGGDLDDTTDPYDGTKNLLMPTGVSNVVKWKKATTVPFVNDDLLNFAFQVPNTLGTGRNPRIQIKLIDSTSSQYWIKTISGNIIKQSFQAWRVFSYKLSEFAGLTDPATPIYDTIEFTFINTPEVKVDWVNIQGNVVTVTPTPAELKYFDFACSDESTDLATGVVYYQDLMRGLTDCTRFDFSVKTAPTGSVCEIDVLKNGTTIFVTRPTIDASETSTLTATTPQVISGDGVSFVAGDTIEVEIINEGSTTAAQGLKAQITHK